MIALDLFCLSLNMDWLHLSVWYLYLSTCLHVRTVCGDFTFISNSICICPGDVVIYKCTIMGGNGGSTVFRGLPTTSLFVDCTGNQGRIVLPHSLFSLPQGIKKSCNNGAIIARSLHGGNGIYTSQLSVTVTPELIGDAIECAHDNGTDIIDVVGMAINDTGYFSSSPDKIYISKVGFHPNQLIFQWNSVAPDCPAVHYNILASNCGSCPTTTNFTNITCTDVPTDNQECKFAIQTMVCGNITGNFSNSISINTHTFYPRDTNTAYIASISSLATFLVVSILALLTVIVIILTRSRIKIKAALDLQAITSSKQHTDGINV